MIDRRASLVAKFVPRPPTPRECRAHVLSGGIVEEQTKGWRHSNNGGQWVEATFSVADYDEWTRQDVPRGFLRLVPLTDGPTLADECGDLLVKLCDAVYNGANYAVTSEAARRLVSVLNR